MDLSVKVVGQTANGKDVGYRAIDGSNLYEIAFKDGGEVPAILGGRFTHIQVIEGVINAWLAVGKQAKAATKRVSKSA